MAQVRAFTPHEASDAKGIGGTGDAHHGPVFIPEAGSRPLVIRKFESGATRDTDQGKLDYEGFLSPRALRRFAEYMHKHRHQSDGSLRDSDNWQKGIPRKQYMKSIFRHFMDVWSNMRGVKSEEGLEESLVALMFNVMGLLHEVLEGRDVGN